MDVAELRNALRIDNDEEDALLLNYLGAAEEYIKAACGETVNLELSRAKTVIIMLVSDMYEQRTAYGGKPDFSRSIAVMLTQLRLETELEAENA